MPEIASVEYTYIYIYIYTNEGKHTKRTTAGADQSTQRVYKEHEAKRTNKTDTTPLLFYFKPNQSIKSIIDIGTFPIQCSTNSKK